MLKGIIIVGSVCFLASVQIPAQVPPPPPPPPLIYSAPEASEIFDFIPETGRFKASFPGKPTESNQVMDEAKVTAYKVRRKGSNSVIAITEYSGRLASHSDTVFGVIKEGVLRQAGAKIVSESEIVMDGFKGREFEVSYGMEYRRVRLFLVKDAIFEIQTDVTNWHIISEKTKAEWRKEADRFFASFKILK